MYVKFYTKEANISIFDSSKGIKVAKKGIHAGVDWFMSKLTTIYL